MDEVTSPETARRRNSHNSFPSCVFCQSGNLASKKHAEIRNGKKGIRVGAMIGQIGGGQKMGKRERRGGSMDLVSRESGFF